MDDARRVHTDTPTRTRLKTQRPYLCLRPKDIERLNMFLEGMLTMYVGWGPTSVRSTLEYTRHQADLHHLPLYDALLNCHRVVSIAPERLLEKKLRLHLGEVVEGFLVAPS